MPEGLRGWLIASVGVLLVSLILFVATVVAGFAYFAEKSMPLWVTVSGVVSLLGMGLGFAGLFFVFILAATKGRKQKVVSGADPA